MTHNSEISIVRYALGISHVNHRDRRNTAQSTIDATYPYSRDVLFFPEYFPFWSNIAHYKRVLSN